MENDQFEDFLLVMHRQAGMLTALKLAVVALIETHPEPAKLQAALVSLHERATVTDLYGTMPDAAVQASRDTTDELIAELRVSMQRAQARRSI